MLPKKGKNLHHGGSGGGRELDLGILIATALRTELGSNRQTIKTVMRWTGASERTVKHWFAGTHGPRSEHLVALTRHSEEVLRMLLLVAERGPVVLAAKLDGLRDKLLEMIDDIDAHRRRDRGLRAQWRDTSKAAPA
jgi:hypothetical protein